MKEKPLTWDETMRIKQVMTVYRRPDLSPQDKESIINELDLTERERAYFIWYFNQD